MIYIPDVMKFCNRVTARRLPEIGLVKKKRTAKIISRRMKCHCLTQPFKMHYCRQLRYSDVSEQGWRVIGERFNQLVKRGGGGGGGNQDCLSCQRFTWGAY